MKAGWRKYRRKCSIVNTTLIRPKTIYIAEQPELKIPRKWGFTDFAAHATTHFISYFFLQSFLHQKGKSRAKLKAISSCQAWAQRGEENTRDRTWSIVGYSGTVATTQTNVFKTKKTREKQSRHRQSWVHPEGEAAAHLLSCHSPVLPSAICWVQTGLWLSTGVSWGMRIANEIFLPCVWLRIAVF